MQYTLLPMAGFTEGIASCLYGIVANFRGQFARK
jgi:hypothetical protein